MPSSGSCQAKQGERSMNRILLCQISVNKAECLVPSHQEPAILIALTDGGGGGGVIGDRYLEDGGTEGPCGC